MLDLLTLILMLGFLLLIFGAPVFFIVSIVVDVWKQRSKSKNELNLVAATLVASTSNHYTIDGAVRAYHRILEALKEGPAE